MRSGQITVAAVVTALLMLLLSACTYSSLYFVRIDTEETRLDGFRLKPRLFAFKEQKGAQQGLKKNRYSVTVRVEDAASKIDDDDWQMEPSVVDSLADRFLGRVTGVFVADSLVLHQIPAESGRILLIPDRVNYAPRREDYLTLKFGETDIPRPTDTLVWLMERVEEEEQGLTVFRDNVEGYR